MKTSMLLGSVFLIALAVIGYAILTQPSGTAVTYPPAQTQTTTPPAQTQTQTQTQSNTQNSGYTMALVAQHNAASSCWAAINGNVYDLTNWINQHPGGPENILAICGTDGSAAFNAQHGGQRQPAAELAQFLLGPLTQ